MNEKLVDKLPQLDRIEYQMEENDIYVNKAINAIGNMLLAFGLVFGGIAVFLVDPANNIKEAQFMIMIGAIIFLILMLLGSIIFGWRLNKLNKKFMQKFDIKLKGKR
jgi:uncharacterized membrane protein